jgi:uncharacterized protein (TIGR02186 family)
MRWRAVLLSLSLCFVSGVRADAPKENIEADASTRQVAITSNFTGTEILVFGAVEHSQQPSPEAGTYDVIVVVEGLPQPVVVREKSRVGGIWLNARRVPFAPVPSYYAIASTRPIDEITDDARLDAEGIGFSHVRMVPETNSGLDAKTLNAFKAALIRLKQRDRVYVKSDFGVSFIGRTLFRATIALPPNVPVGPLTARVFLFKEGALLGQYSSRVMLQREGIERFIHDAAMEHPLLYGLVTVLLAGGAGLAAAFAFRRS